jgi:hypothetical protein
MQPGFQFGMAADDEKLALPKSQPFAVRPDAIVISFRETQMRTMVASNQGKNMPSSGHFWLDPLTSGVLMSELTVEDSWLKAVIHVAYGKVDTLELPVPIEMHEAYENKLNGTRVEGTATYANFREFKVNVDENIAPIDDKGKQDR